MTERTRSAAGKGSTDDSENSRFDRARDYVSDKASAASDAVKGQYNRVREQVEDADVGAMLDQVRGYVRSNPGKALLISVGVGFLVGLLLRRDESQNITFNENCTWRDVPLPIAPPDKLDTVAVLWPKIGLIAV